MSSQKRTAKYLSDFFASLQPGTQCGKKVWWMLKKEIKLKVFETPSKLQVKLHTEIIKLVKPGKIKRLTGYKYSNSTCISFTIWILLVCSAKLSFIKNSPMVIYPITLSGLNRSWPSRLFRTTV